FAVPQAQWKALCARIEQLIAGQSLFDSTVSTDLEQTAQRYASRLLAKQSEPVNPSSSRYAEFDVNTIELVRPRSVGIEHLAQLHAVQQLGLESLLQELGLNRHQRAAALGNIIGRMTRPGSEAATHQWLQQRSALGELIDYDFEGMCIFLLIMNTNY
ncbi:MAG: hypothetical protein V3V18_02610, partial [Methylococcales bacterium]